MAERSSQKLKLLYLLKILMERTDENHAMSMPEILEALDHLGITAERKSIYTDIELIRDFGIEVQAEGGARNRRYSIVDRKFELAEVKLLVDSVSSAKFITEKKSSQLIKKIESLVSNHEAKELQRQVYVSGRIKTMNESIYYNVDTLQNAILANQKIHFQYFQWNVKKEPELRHDGEFYEVSPWALSWDDENYYLIGFDAKDGIIKHYRVDKMLKISALKDKREGKEFFEKFDMAAYAKKSFGMYGGEEQYVKLLCENRLAGVIIDRFGKDVMLVPVDKDHFHANVNVAVSDPFLGWVFTLGEGIKIVGPNGVVEQMKDKLSKTLDLYK